MTIEDINILQNKFHLLLEQYLNGYTFSKFSKILFPFIKNLQTHSTKDLVSVINKMTGSDFTPKTNKEMAQYICSIYSILQKHLQNDKCIEKKIKAKYTFNSNNYNEPQKTILENLVSYMKKKNIDRFIDIFLIHGSYSTLDYEPNISDLDTLILLKEDVFKDCKKLIELQTILYNALDFFYNIDILQHHGFFILTNYDTKYFNETFFPTMLFDYSTKVLGEKNEIDFFIRTNTLERENIFRQTIEYLELNNPENFDRIMTYKVYFQVLQLVPIAYLQYKNVPSYKKYSFDLFLKDFPQYKELFADIYQLRLDWKQNSIEKLQSKNLLYRALPNRIVFYLNSKIEKVDEGIKQKFGNDVFEQNIKPLVEDLKKAIDDKKL